MRLVQVIISILFITSCSFVNNEQENIAIKKSTNYIIEDCERDLRLFQAVYRMNPNKVGPYYNPVESSFNRLMQYVKKTEIDNERLSIEYEQTVSEINEIVKESIDFSSIPYLRVNDSIVGIGSKDILVNDLTIQFANLLLHIYGFIDAPCFKFDVVTSIKEYSCDSLSVSYILNSKFIQSYNDISKEIIIDSILTISDRRLLNYSTVIDSSFGRLIVESEVQEELRIFGKAKLVATNGDVRMYPIVIEK